MEFGIIDITNASRYVYQHRHGGKKGAAHCATPDAVNMRAKLEAAHGVDIFTYYDAYRTEQSKQSSRVIAQLRLTLGS